MLSVQLLDQPDCRFPEAGICARVRVAARVHLHCLVRCQPQQIGGAFVGNTMGNTQALSTFQPPPERSWSSSCFGTLPAFTAAMTTSPLVCDALSSDAFSCACMRLEKGGLSGSWAMRCAPLRPLARPVLVSIFARCVVQAIGNLCAGSSPYRARMDKCVAVGR